jgi:hypothetical protein
VNDRLRTVLVLSLATACAVCLTATAGAAGKHSNLRVEALGKTLDPGTNYSNPRITTRNSNACGARESRTERLGGGNAMGIVANAAESNRRLSPFRTSDTFASEAGLLACQIGAYKGFDDRSWLYRVNLRAVNRSADRKRVDRNDDVLWYFADFSNGRNTGDALELRGAPAAADPGEEFQVRVLGYPFSGTPAPAAGVSVTGASEPTAADGTTTVTAISGGVMRLRASGGDAVRSARVEVCVAAGDSRCRDPRGETFVGTGGPDRLVATGGGDVIRPGGGNDAVAARAGADRVQARDGDRDRVNCGAGQDSVAADGRDRLSDNCEQVSRKR